MITIRQQPNASIPFLRFLVGEKRVRAQQIPVFVGATNKAIGERESLMEQTTVWHVLGFGITAEHAKAMAKKAVGPDFFCVEDMGSSLRFEPENQVAA